MLKLRGFLFALGFYPATLLYAIPCLLIGPLLPFKARFRFLTAINYFYIAWLRWTCGLGVEIEGREHLPQTGAYVVLANHQSEWETLYFQLLIRPQAVVLKQELLKIPFFGWALRLLEPIALDRSQRREALRQLLEQGRDKLEQGIPVLIFPQGTRVKAGETGRFNKGGTLLAQASGVPIIPMVHNAGRFWPGKSFIKYPGKVQLRIGAPIATAGRSADEVQAEVVAWMQAQMQALGA
ncbi:lysophospholipid acyltransferase family protein [Nitrincola tapanii]|uniref:1-acyl-sn-glycerol-3-phosphate acyltransferase n=1 Tax=Nitrincola tapanii TaxID=1708751 RepID=A0A5A9W6H6_9GAMM|nr:lysophospholipid acyltransferase family protein [Nitrincola tapanii]KAA0876316.1 1-acyl-sn-glycerol-3-phosphate acyltransferase [Nitrincola tapanii]